MAGQSCPRQLISQDWTGKDARCKNIRCRGKGGSFARYWALGAVEPVGCSDLNFGHWRIGVAGRLAFGKSAHLGFVLARIRCCALKCLVGGSLQRVENSGII